MIKVHAFYCNDGTISPVTFVFQHEDGTWTTFNSDCWENGKPVIRNVQRVHYDLMGARLLAPSRHVYADMASLLSIDMENGDPFEIFVDEHREYLAYEDCWLGVANDPDKAFASAFGAQNTAFKWATRRFDHALLGGSLRGDYDMAVAHLVDDGVDICRAPSSTETHWTTHAEEFGWVLDYGTGKLIEGVGTAAPEETLQRQYGEWIATPVD